VNPSANLSLVIMSNPHHTNFSLIFAENIRSTNHRFHLGIDGSPCHALEWAERLDRAAQAIRKAHREDSK
jgi:hypothetical protein